MAKQFDVAGAVTPELAPNWNQIPFQDHEANDAGHPIRTRLPDGLNNSQKANALQTGNFVPQNHEETPYDLKNFAPAPTSIQRGDTRKGATGH